MNIKDHLTIRSTVLKGHVNKYAMLGLAISCGSILVASILVAYQITGSINLSGILLAQTSNPAIWALDLTPLMFAYWGQSFVYELANKAELIIEDRTREFALKSDDLEVKLKYESNHDGLTNLPNSRLLIQRIQQAIQQLQEGDELAVITLNINNFKEINYKFGNFNANSLLMQFAEKLKSLLLEPYMLQPYMAMNMVARLQGAEFAILIPRLKKEHNFDNILKSLVQGTSLNFMVDGNSIKVSTTMGAAIFPRHADNEEMLIHNATLCLLNSEKEGKPYAIYHPYMGKNYQGKRLLLQEVNQAILQEKIEVLYVPYVQLDTRKIVGAEATIKFNDPNFGVLNADKLMPIVEGTTLSQHLLFFTLKQAITQLDFWHQHNYKINLTVNLNQALDTKIVDYIQQLLMDHKLSTEFLKIALTERACLSDQTNSMAVLNQLAEKGIKIAISDFCSGYSSFVYLTNFPIHSLKIDPAFVMNMAKDDKKRIIVKGILNLAETLNLNVVADGINDESILQDLLALGCKCGQGSLFSTAIDVEQFTQLLKTS
jgi:diguanylate cyclase (GGDEF)-like protein